MTRVLYEYLLKNWVIYCLLIGYGVLLFLNSLGLQIWLPECIITQFSGYECLGCGLNHAAVALLSGNIKAAANYNPLIFIYLPLIIGWISHDFYKFNLNTNQSKYEKHG